jgi:hypothetical protein
MPRPKPTKEDFKEREQLAIEVRLFAKENLFTEIKLAEVLGISRRTLQMIKAGNVSPHPSTLRKWKALSEKYNKAAAVTRLMRDGEEPNKAKRKRKAA